MCGPYNKYYIQKNTQEQNGRHCRHTLSVILPCVSNVTRFVKQSAGLCNSRYPTACVYREGTHRKRSPSVQVTCVTYQSQYGIERDTAIDRGRPLDFFVVFSHLSGLDE